ncbi:PucR family transcriptional regulator [Streptomyces sp. NPDC059850]|uniref:PucR family transcriptional regulator n=1 Tax=Streptomyces sp. NPDC059850 TaxID=3346970 RepID=UPI003669A7AB
MSQRQADPDDRTPHSLLRVLRPSDDTVVERAAVGLPLLAEAVDRVGRRPTGWAVETSTALSGEVVRECRSPERPSPASDERFVEALVLWSVLALREASPPDPLLAELGATVGELVHLGLPVDLALKYLRVTHARVSSLLFTRCASAVPGTAQADVMRETSARLFNAMEQIASWLCEHFAAERERWLADSRARRAELARSLLSGAKVSPGQASTRLGYDLTLHHLALVLWCEHHVDGCVGELEREARQLLERAGYSSVLLLPAGPGRLWAWGGRASGPPPETGRLRAAPEAPPHAHIAAGLPGAGLAGFRRSHEQAGRVETVVRTSGSPASVHDYASVELAVLLGGDLNSTAGFVTRELGPLAGGGETNSALRETVKCYLDHERSLSTAAERLHVAKNTVAYRVKKAEHLLGRSLREERLRLHVALHLAQTLGTAVLRGVS